jgi:hypothetical protein
LPALLLTDFRPALLLTDVPSPASQHGTAQVPPANPPPLARTGRHHYLGGGLDMEHAVGDVVRTMPMLGSPGLYQSTQQAELRSAALAPFIHPRGVWQ